MNVTVAVLLIVLAGAVTWFMVRSSGYAELNAADDEIDHDELSAAEQEVQELDVFTDPEEADDQLPDWGPGAPK